MSRFFELCPNPSDKQLSALCRWYWTISFNEGLRGKPDHYVTRILRRVGALAAGKFDALNVRLSVTAADFIDRRFIQGKALSGALATMFAVQGARSLFTGELIPPSDYMTEFVAKNYQPFLSTRELSRQAPSNKLLANTVLVSSDEAYAAKSLRAADCIAALFEKDVDQAQAICDSQFIPANAVEALRRGEYDNFIDLR